MRRINPKLAVPITALALLFAGCGGGSAGSPASTPSASGGEKDLLTLGSTLDIQGWSPINQPGYQSWALEAVWDSLVKCDGNGKQNKD